MKKEIIKNRKVSRQRVAVTVIFVQRGPTLQQDNFAHWQHVLFNGKKSFWHTRVLTFEVEINQTNKSRGESQIPRTEFVLEIKFP